MANRIEVLDEAGHVLGSGSGRFLSDGSIDAEVPIIRRGRPARLQMWFDEWRFPILAELETTTLRGVGPGDRLRIESFGWEIEALKQRG